MLTAAQLTARDGRLTASRVACPMTGEEAKTFGLIDQVMERRPDLETADK